jgi:Uma2 family endonuclease
MTVTDTVGYRPTDWWTIDDLAELPDDGMRYELVDGSLLMSPSPSPRHAEVQHDLGETLRRQAPPGIIVHGDAGIEIGSRFTYFVPDLYVIPRAAFRAQTLDGTEYTPEIVPAGKTWTTDHPFPLTLDPAEFC